MENVMNTGERGKGHKMFTLRCKLLICSVVMISATAAWAQMRVPSRVRAEPRAKTDRSDVSDARGLQDPRLFLVEAGGDATATTPGSNVDVVAQPGTTIAFDIYAEITGGGSVDVAGFQFVMACASTGGDGGAVTYAPASVTATGANFFACGAGFFGTVSLGDCSVPDEPGGLGLANPGDFCALSSPVLVGTISYVVPGNAATYDPAGNSYIVVIEDQSRSSITDASQVGLPNLILDGANITILNGQCCDGQTCVPGAGNDGQTTQEECADLSPGAVWTEGLSCLDPCACTENQECAVDEYCAKADGDCAGRGTCQIRADACLMYWDPLCGCDGETYSNATCAAVAGVNIAYPGDCTCVDGSDCDDGNECTDNVCDSGTCTYPNNTAGCDDGDACTTGDACSGGTCSGTAADCSGLDDQCNVGVCNPATGACEAQPNNDGQACDDAEFCTTGETCSAGLCSGGTPTDCSVLGDQCNVGVCNPATGACEAQPINDAQPCDDGEFCTTGETCSAGVCGGGTPTDCSTLDDQCNVGVCNEAAGACEAQPTNDNQPCVDNDACTENDTCTSGICVGTPIDCSSLDTPCSAGVCNPGTGMCEAQPINEGQPCNDGLLCTEGDTCIGGTCTGTAVDCPPGEVCDPADGLCKQCIDGETCTDDDMCTENDTCANGTCVGTPIDCSALDGPCSVGVCNPGTGVCEPQPINDGQPCDDVDACTENDTCSNGTCAGTPLDCSLLDGPCTNGVCNPGTGACEAQPINDGQACDDGVACTENDTCSAGTCAGTPIDCSGLDGPCSVGVCNPATGVCEAQPINEGQTCDDGDLCTTGDTCTGGVCVAAPTDCSALDAECVRGVCDPATGACEPEVLPDGEPCEDGDLCTENDTCVSGVCTTGTAVDCDDSITCTVDSCEPAHGCIHDDTDCLGVITINENTPDDCFDPTDNCFNDETPLCVTVDISDLEDQPIAGAQFFLDYDPSLLEFVAIGPGDHSGPGLDFCNTPGVSPFLVPIFVCTPLSPPSDNCTPTLGKIGYAVAIPFGAPGTTAEVTLATIRFTVLDSAGPGTIGLDPDLDDCAEGSPATQLVDDQGNARCMNPTLAVPFEYNTDNVPPTFVGCEDISLTSDAGLCDAVVDDLACTATDEGCDQADNVCSFEGIRSDGRPLGDTYPVDVPQGAPQWCIDACGTDSTCILWTAIDCACNESTTVQCIEVKDKEDPTITCPPDVTQTADPGECSAIIPDLPMAVCEDNCECIVVCVRDDGLPLDAAYPVGTTTINCTASDGADPPNTATCSFTVTVTDDENPTIACPADITETADQGVCGTNVDVTDQPSAMQKADRQC